MHESNSPGSSIELPGCITSAAGHGGVLSGDPTQHRSKFSPKKPEAKLAASWGCLWVQLEEGLLKNKPKTGRGSNTHPRIEAPPSGNRVFAFASGGCRLPEPKYQTTTNRL